MSYGGGLVIVVLLSRGDGELRMSLSELIASSARASISRTSEKEQKWEVEGEKNSPYPMSKCLHT